MGDRVGESAGFILKDAQEEISLSDMVWRRITDQEFEPSFFPRIVFELVRLLESFSGRLLACLVICQHPLIVPGRLIQLLRQVMHASEQEPRMTPETWIGKRSEH